MHSKFKVTYTLYGYIGQGKGYRLLYKCMVIVLSIYLISHFTGIPRLEKHVMKTAGYVLIETLLYRWEFRDK